MNHLCGAHLARHGLGIGARRVTISTCGVVPGIERLAREGFQVKLAVSLNAPDNARRTKLMPVNRKLPLEELMAACGQIRLRKLG